MLEPTLESDGIMIHKSPPLCQGAPPRGAQQSETIPKAFIKRKSKDRKATQADNRMIAPAVIPSRKYAFGTDSAAPGASVESGDGTEIVLALGMMKQCRKLETAIHIRACKIKQKHGLSGRPAPIGPHWNAER